MRSFRLSLVASIVLAAGSTSAPRAARADWVEDAASKAGFWAPDGWTASRQTRGAWTLLLRRAADEKAMCGMAIGTVPGTLERALEEVEALWKQGPERYERLTKTPALVAGTSGLHVEHKITIPKEGRTLRAWTVVAGAGDRRVALWCAHEAGLEESYGPIVRRVLESIVLPTVATAGGPPAPAAPVPPSNAGLPSSGAPQGVGLLFDPRFREGRPAEVLVAGDDPLLRGAVDAFVDVVEAANESTLPEADEQALRDAVEAGWKKASPDDRAMVDGAVALRESHRRRVDGASESARAEARAALAGPLLSRASSDPARPWQAVVRRADTRRHEVFASTDPVVYLSEVDALEELLSFFTSLARNDGARVTEGQRLAVRAEKLRPAIEGADAVHRRRFASMHRLLGFVRARWDGAAPDAKLRARWAAVDLARGVARLPDVSVDAKAEGLPAYARAATEAAAALPVFEAYANVFVNLDAVVAALVEALGTVPGGANVTIEQAFASEPIAWR